MALAGLAELELFVDSMVPALTSNDAIAKAINRRMRVIERRLESSLSGSGNRNDGAIAEELVPVVRTASRHPQYGKYIGRDCMTVITNSESTNSESSAMTAHTYIENSVEHDWPWMVYSGNMVVGGSYSITKEDGTDAFVGI